MIKKIDIRSTHIWQLVGDNLVVYFKYLSCVSIIILASCHFNKLQLDYPGTSERPRLVFKQLVGELGEIGTQQPILLN